MAGRTVAVVTDSTSDVPRELAGRHGVTTVPLTVSLGGQSYLDGVEIQPDAFYARLGEEGAVATTSQPAPGRFADVYERLLRDHDEVVSLHISSKMSGTHAAAVQGAEMAGQDRVRVLDTGMVSMPLGLLVLAAATMAGRGDGADRIVERLRPLQDGLRVYFMVATLEHLRRGGRIGRASALLGSVLQVKPVLTIADGEVTPMERVRTQDKALTRVIELAAELQGPVCAFVGHAAAGEAARRIAEALEPRAESLIVAPLGPVVGAHAGPGTVGVGCYPAELFPLDIQAAGSLAAP
jgi:fatty acid kinase fatty acid binding subunit